MTESDGYVRTGGQAVAGAVLKTPSLGEAKQLVKTWMVDKSQNQALINYTKFCQSNGTVAPKKTAWNKWMQCVRLAESEEYAVARASADFDNTECGAGHMAAFLEMQHAEQAKKEKAAKKEKREMATAKELVRSASKEPAHNHMNV